jgi:hypothetical protein
LAQGEALYEGIIEEEKRSIEAIKTSFEAEAKLFELNLKATIKRMQRRNLEQEES